jgi:hypothetical protein
LRKFPTIAGLLLVFIGGVWILQGIGFLPGSFMTGQTRWAIIGGIVLAVGILVLLVRRRLGRPTLRHQPKKDAP